MSDHDGTNIASEFSLIGGLVERQDRFSSIRMLRPEHFSHIGLRTVYESMCALHDNGVSIESTAILSKLSERDVKTYQIGAWALTDAIGSADPLCDVEYHANAILRGAARRALAAIGADLQNIAFDTEKDPSTLAAEIADRIREATNDADPDAGIITMEKAMLGEMNNYSMYNEARENGRELGITLGYDIDNYLGGLMGGNLIYMAGRPGMGKSTVALNFAASLAERGIQTAYFSLEMSDSELSQKLIARYARIDSSRLRTYDLASEAEAERMMLAVNRIAKMPIYLSVSSASLAGILSRAYRMVRQRGVRVIFIDYVQLVAGEMGNGNNGNRQQELSYISQALKRLAVETGTVVIALSQLNRAVEGRSDKRPLLSDLRDSGSLEQDGDAVILLYRSDYYDEMQQGAGSGGVSGQVELILAKNRHGPTGISTLMLHRDVSLLSNMSGAAEF